MSPWARRGLVATLVLGHACSPPPGDDPSDESSARSSAGPIFAERLDEARRELAQRGPGRVRPDDPLMAEVEALAGGVRVLGNRGNEEPQLTADLERYRRGEPRRRP